MNKNKIGFYISVIVFVAGLLGTFSFMSFNRGYAALFLGLQFIAFLGMLKYKDTF